MIGRFDVTVSFNAIKTVQVYARDSEEARYLAKNAVLGMRYPSCIVSDAEILEVFDIPTGSIKCIQRPNQNEYEDLFIQIYEDGDHREEAEFCLENNISLLDYDWWTHTEDVIGVKMTHGEYCELLRMLDRDMLELDEADVPDVLRKLIYIRSTDK